MNETPVKRTESQKELLRQLDESLSGAAAKTHKPRSEGFFEGVKRFVDDLTR